MSRSQRIASRAELPQVNCAREFTCGERTICIANVNGHYSALDNVCVHRGGPLGQGEVVDGKVVCPWHGWEFDPRTGEAGRAGGPAQTVYPLRIEGDDVLVEL